MTELRTNAHDPYVKAAMQTFYAAVMKLDEFKYLGIRDFLLASQHATVHNAAVDLHRFFVVENPDAIHDTPVERLYLKLHNYLGTTQCARLHRVDQSCVRMQIFQLNKYVDVLDISDLTITVVQLAAAQGMRFLEKGIDQVTLDMWQNNCNRLLLDGERMPVKILSLDVFTTPYTVYDWL